MPIAADFASHYGPVALVTGASSGIGREFARQLATAGLDLVLVARRQALIETLAKELAKEHGVEVTTLPLDLGCRDFLDMLLPACEGRDIGLVVSNAGLGAKGLLDETPLETLEAVLAVNCRAPMLVAHAFLPLLRRRGRGGIVITGSIEAYTPAPWSVAYSASKAFVRALGEGLWGEVRGSGVDVLVLAPGATDTEMITNSGMDVRDMPTGAMTPADVARQGLERLGGGPSHIAGVANFLLVSLLSLLPRRLALLAAGRGMRDAIEKGRRRSEEG